MNPAESFQNNAIFWIETDKIKPNPFQPRREFDQEKLHDLSESIRAYGVLQPLVVTRKETVKDDGGIAVEYELLAGERRLRASKLVGLPHVPVLIRAGENSDREKLEISIIENLQREDLNAVERARAFKRLAEDFGFKHHEIGTRVGKSRVYVTNTMRILDLPDEILDAVSSGVINEGHTRPLLMLVDRPDEQMVLFKEISVKKITVREAEETARKIAVDRARKKDVAIDPEMVAIESKLRESLGTRVHILKRETGGKILIDFFSTDDLMAILAMLESKEKRSPSEMIDRHLARMKAEKPVVVQENGEEGEPPVTIPPAPAEPQEDEETLYSVRNFTV